MALERIGLYESPFRLSMKVRTHVRNVPWYDPKTSTLDKEHIDKAIEWSAMHSNLDMQDEVRAYIIRLLMERYDITEDSLTTRRHRAKWTMQVIPTTSTKMLGGIKMYGNKFPVMRFNVSPQTVPSQKGIAVRDRVKISIGIVRGKVRKGVPNRFLARMPKSGHIGVFYRENAAQNGDSLPIDEEYFHSIPEILAGNRFKFKIQKYMDNAFLKYYDKYILKSRPIATNPTYVVSYMNGRRTNTP